MDSLKPFAMQHLFSSGENVLFVSVVTLSLLLQTPMSLISPLEMFEIFVSFQGYALLCVSFPCSDLEVETQDEDEVTSNIAIIICTV